MCSDTGSSLDGRSLPNLGDPVDLALQASRKRRDEDRDWLPDPFCPEVGRRLLLAQLEFSQWILRRVEKVQFERERSVSRNISIDFVVRDDAPVFAGHGNQTLMLVPLSVMRRRTLVNLALTDESGRRIPMLGLRLTQQLDESMLLAAAVAHDPELANDTDLIKFVQKAVAGTAEQVDDALALFRGQKPRSQAPEPEPDCLSDLRDCELFKAVFNRLHRNFTLYVVLDSSLPRHRVLTLSFDEPTNWVLQKPTLTPKTQDYTRSRIYNPMQKVFLLHRLLLNATTHLGLTATRIRFQTPGAEHATSYHFEATAPLGVRIVEASLLAGRPNDLEHPVSVDRIIGHTPSVGLHAVEIPNVSLCRVQLKLRVPLHGWLTTLVVSCLMIALMLAVITWQWPLTVAGVRMHRESAPAWSKDQVTNVVLLLVTASASAATLIAHREFGGLAAVMVSRLRAVGVCSLALPIVAAVALVYAEESPWKNRPDRLGNLLWTLTGLAVVAWLLALAAAMCSRAAETRSTTASPWDMTLNRGQPGLAPKERSQVRSDTFDNAAHDLGFGRPAIGIASAEGWHAHYDWTDSRQKHAIKRLRQPEITSDEHEPGNPSHGCATWASCPAHRFSQLSQPVTSVAEAQHRAGPPH